MIPDTLPMSRPYTVAIIQARMGSSRLPSKVLFDIAGQPMLVRVVERTGRADTVDKVVVATTTEPSDDTIASLCAERSYPCYRGSLHDVLDRYYQAARLSSAHVIVRITADCPLIDPDVIDITVKAFLGLSASNQQRVAISNPPSAIQYPKPEIPYDFAANRLPPPWGRTYPIGLDTEVCTFQALEIAWREADQTHQREHVMPFFYEHQERFRLMLVNHEADYGSLRWTVDTAEDLELVRQIYASFPGRDDFSWLEVLKLFEVKPEMAQINAGVRHKVYNEVDHRQQ
jgi:spore coat polysaccharide biosynthesis protein SpsF